MNEKEQKQHTLTSFPPIEERKKRKKKHGGPEVVCIRTGKWTRGVDQLIDRKGDK